MSQEKVNRYKEEKANRKKTMAKEKVLRRVKIGAAAAVAVVIVGWAGFSGYRAYQNNKPIETIYTNLSAIETYMSALDTEQ